MSPIALYQNSYYDDACYKISFLCTKVICYYLTRFTGYLEMKDGSFFYNYPGWFTEDVAHERQKAWDIFAANISLLGGRILPYWRQFYKSARLGKAALGFLEIASHLDKHNYIYVAPIHNKYEHNVTLNRVKEIYCKFDKFKG